MRVLLLSNPRSGTSRRRRRTQRFVERLRADGAQVDEITPGSAEETTSAAASARKSMYDFVLASGGDGTLHTIVNGLVRIPRNERPKLAILPGGRGNDFAADLGIRCPEDCLRAMAANEVRPIDLGRAEHGVFLSIAGTGFDARAARKAQQTPWLSGSALYTYAALRTLLEFRPVVARVSHDEGTFEGPITFAATGNTRRYGGGMRIAPEADPEDGRLDLCLVKDISRLSLLRMFPRVFSGGHLSHPAVEYIRTSFVRVETEQPCEVFADGEYFQMTPISIGVMPAELEIAAPNRARSRARGGSPRSKVLR
jgi:diacylglycerol kinase (ATP)